MFSIIKTNILQVPKDRLFFYNGTLYRKDSDICSGSYAFPISSAPQIFQFPTNIELGMLEEGEKLPDTDTEFKVGDTVFAIRYRDTSVEATCKRCRGKRGGCGYCNNGKRTLYYSEGHPTTAVLITIIKTTNTSGTETSYEILSGSSVRTVFYKNPNKKAQYQLFKTEHECKLASDADNIAERDMNIKRYLDGTDN